jgi:hypothetical protein
MEPCSGDDFAARQVCGRTLARFAAYLALGGVQASTVKKYVGHVKTLHHERFGVAFLQDLIQVKRVFEGLEAREAGNSERESRRKAPFTWGMFLKVLPVLLASESSADAELVVVLAVGISFLLRASELLPDGVTSHYLRRKDVLFGPLGSAGLPDWVTLNLRSSKMHRCRKLRSLGLDRDAVGVVSLLWSYHARTGDYRFAERPLFPTIKRSFLSVRLRQVASSLGMGEAHRLASHSLRRGGATSLLASGVEAHVVQRFGRWASDMWVETYAELQFDKQLALASCLEPRGDP